MQTKGFTVVKDNNTTSSKILVLRVIKENATSAYAMHNGNRISIDDRYVDMVSDGNVYFCSIEKEGKESKAYVMKDASLDDLLGLIENKRSDVAKIIYEADPKYFEEQIKDLPVKETKVVVKEDESKIKEFKAAVANQTKELNASRKEAERLQKKNDVLAEKDREQKEAINDLKREIKQLKKDLEEASKSMKVADMENSALRGQISDLEKNRTDAAANGELMDVFKKISAQMDAQQKEISELKDGIQKIENIRKKDLTPVFVLKEENMECAGPIGNVDWNYNAFAFESDLLYNPKFTADRYRVTVTPDRSIITVASDPDGSVYCENNMLYATDIAAYANIVPKKMVAINFLG